jgi:hypothetical protein
LAYIGAEGDNPIGQAVLLCILLYDLGKFFLDLNCIGFIKFVLLNAQKGNYTGTAAKVCASLFSTALAKGGQKKGVRSEGQAVF